MNIFLEFLKLMFVGLVAVLVAVVLVCWITASIETLHYTKQNNVLLREMCVENGLNPDSLIITAQNDTLNLKIESKAD